MLCGCYLIFCFFVCGGVAIQAALQARKNSHVRETTWRAAFCLVGVRKPLHAHTWKRISGSATQSPSLGPSFRSHASRFVGGWRCSFPHFLSPALPLLPTPPRSVWGSEVCLCAVTSAVSPASTRALGTLERHSGMTLTNLIHEEPADPGSLGSLFTVGMLPCVSLRFHPCMSLSSPASPCPSPSSPPPPPLSD